MQKPVAPITNNLEAFWMPFSANRQFKKEPRLLVRAEGVNYWSHDGRKVLDGTFGSASFQVGANVGETISVNLATSMRSTAIGRTADYASGDAYSSTLAVGQQGAGVTTVAFVAGDLTIAIGSGSAVSVGASTAGAAAGQSAGSAYAKVSAINSAGVSGLTATAERVFGRWEADAVTGA